MAHIRLRRKACISGLFVGIMFLVLLRERFRTDFYEVRVSDSGSNANFVGLSTVSKHVEPFKSGEVSQEITIKIVAAILVIACNRPQVQRCLDSLLRHRPLEEKFPIIVSQDCGHEETARVIGGYGKKVHSIKHPDLSDITLPGASSDLKGYFKLSRHYKWALTQAFDIMQYDTIIIVEDDLEVAPDFFEYFEATESLLEKDPTLWCVSAWNDNGKKENVRGNDLLYRSDFFPGLGWMLKKTLWYELRPKWPASFWDDWMRHPEQRKERACIRPEIPRVATFGKTGVSKGQFFEEHLQYIKLNDKFYPFSKANLTFLIKGQYDPKFIFTVYKSPLVSSEYFDSGRIMPAPAVRVQYETEETFVSLAKQLGIMDDWKAGVPRMAYRGVVSFMFKNTRVYLAPPRNWKGYKFEK